MIYSSRRLAKALLKIILMSKKDDKIIANFLDFCRRKNLTHKLPNIFKYLAKEEKERADKETVLLETIEPLEAEVIKKIKKFIGARETTPLKLDFNRELKGGFRAVYRNIIYDGSVRQQLERLKEKMSQ